MPEIGHVTIAAGGQGSRMREYMNSTRRYPISYPKHLLPTGAGETLLGRLVDQASEQPIPTKPTINVNPENQDHITKAIGDAANYDSENFVFSLDAFYYRVRREDAQGIGAFVLCCAGDVYTKFSWEQMIEAHQRSGAAISALVKKAEADTQAAQFDVDPQTGRITQLRRPDLSPSGSYTNIGMCIIEPTPGILSVLHDTLPEDPRDCSDGDHVFVEMVRRGLAGIVDCGDAYSTNINTPREYEGLLARTATEAALAD